MNKHITPKFDFFEKNLNEQDFLAFINLSLEDEFDLKTKDIWFNAKRFKSKRVYFELDQLVIKSRMESFEDWRKIDHLDVSATHQSYIILAMLILLSNFNQKEIKIKINNNQSFIKKLLFAQLLCPKSN